MKYILGIIIVLFSSDLYAGEYRLSNGWPTGINAHIYTMSASEKEKCRTISKLLNLQKINKPIKCEFYNALRLSKINLLDWKELNEIRSIEVYKAIEMLKEKRSGRVLKWNMEIEEWLKNSIRGGEIKIESSSFTPNKSSNITTFFRVKKGKCTDNMLFSQMTFYAYENVSKDIVLIPGVLRNNEIFLWDGNSYIIEESYRNFDDSFKYKLEPPQPLLFIRNIERSRMCRFLYWEE